MTPPATLTPVAPPAAPDRPERYTRRAWSRTDTARWLDDRNAPLLALLRRHPRATHDYHDARIRFAGTLMRDTDRALFDPIHAALRAAPDDPARDALHLHALLP